MSDIEQLVEELHRKTVPVKQFRKVVTKGLDDVWGIDLMEMPDPAINDGYRYALIVEDIFSRYVWIALMKNKDAKTSWTAMQKVLDDAGTKPKKLWADQGSEFYNNIWKANLKKLKVELYSTYADWGVAPVESAIRTLKNWVQPKLELQGSLKWIDILPEVVKYYNDKHKHTTLKMTPQEARNPEIEKELFVRQYGAPEPMSTKPKYKVGDWVRVARKKNVFEKGFDARFSYQPYKIRQVNVGEPVTYYLKERNGEKVLGAWYEQELQKTEVPDTGFVQQVVKKKGNKSLVRWRGIPPSYDTWIPTAELESLQAKK